MTYKEEMAWLDSKVRAPLEDNSDLNHLSKDIKILYEISLKQYKRIFGEEPN